MTQQKHKVKFYDNNGKCYFSSTAKFIDITTQSVLIDLSKDNDPGYSNIFRAFDTLQQIEVLKDFILISFSSGQRISILLNNLVEL